MPWNLVLWSAAILPILLNPSVLISAQQEIQLTVQPAGSFPAPNSARQLLLDKSQDDLRKNIAAKLDLRDNEGKLISDSFDSVRIESPVLEKGRSHAVLIIHSDRWWTDFLTVLEKRGSEWQLTKTLPIFCKNQRVNVTFPDLIESGVQEIQIDAETIFTGTGGWQYNLVILKVFDGSLTVIFDQPKLVNWSHPISVGAKYEDGNQHRDTAFSIAPSDQDPRSRYVIVGREVLKQATAQVVTYSLHRWNPAMRRFRSQPIEERTFNAMILKRPK